jgi:hypothetical protein
MAARLVTLAAGAALAAAAPTRAVACVEVGVYEDRPLRELPALTQHGGRGPTVLSVYVTAGELVPPRIVRFADRRRLRLLVTFMADGGTDGPGQRRFTLRRVARGAVDAGLARLARQLAARRQRAVLRLLPEPNTPWYAWSGLAPGNRPAAYGVAFRHLARVVRAVAGRRVQLMWTPYARSIPDTAQNAIARYFPGPRAVDLVGADDYDFGPVAGLDRASPAELFDDAYATITALAPRPFWIAETGSTPRSGPLAAFIDALADLDRDLPLYAGVVWHDARDGNGDFRIRQSPAAVAAFTRHLGEEACR